MAWSDIDFSAEGLAGWESPSPSISDQIKAKGRDTLRDRLRLTLQPLIRRAGVQEIVFYDTLQALDTDTEIYLSLVEFFLRECLWLYWAKFANRPGVGTNPADRRDFYDDLQDQGLSGLFEQIQYAMDLDEISFSSTRPEESDAPLWAIA